MNQASDSFDEKLIKEKFPKLYEMLFGPIQPFQEQLMLEKVSRNLMTKD